MKLAAYLDREKKTYAQFGAEVEAPERTVAKWARGERVPRDKMSKIFEATNGEVTPNDFHELHAGQVA